MMKRAIQNWLICCSILFVYPFTSTAQQYMLPDIEKVTLFTDRSVYITGEDVCFSAFIDQEDFNLSLSKILYVEIISPDGNSFSAGKFEIDKFTSSGCLRVPEELITGVYFIRAYTKYMRNVGPNSYTYLALKIINPRRGEVLPGRDTLDYLAYQNNEISNRISITIEKETIHPRDEVAVNIQSELDVVENIRGITISVAPSEASKNLNLTLKGTSRAVKKLQYVPEINGITVTGMVLQDKKPMKDVMVNLSLIESYNDFQVEKTDSAGRFLFLMPDLIDLADIYIGEDGDKSLQKELQVDNEFCVLPVDLPHPIFSLTGSERNQVLNMAVNHEITNAFLNDSMIDMEHNPSHQLKKAFYGTPVYVLYLKDYVQLPTLEEYFNELPGYVKVRRKDGKKYFKIFGDQPEMETYDPLILVDGVYIDDPEKILKASPVNIDRIEMINTPYLKGDMVFGGILSIITKRGDFAGIDLPESGFFVSYHFLDPEYYSGKFYPKADIPDSRNTVYFQPLVVMDNNNKTTIKFITPNTPGSYSIVLNGVTKHGTVFTKARTFEVIPYQLQSSQNR